MTHKRDKRCFLSLVYKSLFLVTLFLSPALLADGRVYPPSAMATSVTIPEQQALIHFDGKTERLVIQTQFTGSGTNFAWVVPLPSPPKIEPATTGLFPTLQSYFRPEIEHEVTPYWIMIMTVLSVAYLALSINVKGGLNQWDRLMNLLMLGAGMIAFWFSKSANYPWYWTVVCLMPMGVSVLMLLVRDVESRAWRLGCIRVFSFCWLLLMAYLFGWERFDRGRSAGDSSTSAFANVSILDRQVVGVFETTIIRSQDPNALTEWLEINGYAVTSEDRPVIASYVRDGWVFAASKLRREIDQAGNSTLHPISFTFATTNAVYPMRLTGVGSDKLSVALYIFGRERAQAKHFQVAACTKPIYDEHPRGWGEMFHSQYIPSQAYIRHSLLRNWVSGAPVATKLSATLKKSQMRQDVWIKWAAFAEERSALYSPWGALTVGLNRGIAVFAIGLCFGYALNRGQRGGERWLSTWIRKVACVATVVLIAAYLSMPRTSVVFVNEPARQTGVVTFALAEYICREVDKLQRSPSAAEIREFAREFLAKPEPDFFHYAGHYEVETGNYLVGGQVHEEDSPGNFVLREADGCMNLISYDALGEEHQEFRIRLRKANSGAAKP